MPGWGCLWRVHHDQIREALPEAEEALTQEDGGRGEDDNKGSRGPGGGDSGVQHREERCRGEAEKEEAMGRGGFFAF